VRARRSSSMMPLSAKATGPRFRPESGERHVDTRAGIRRPICHMKMSAGSRLLNCFGLSYACPPSHIVVFRPPQLPWLDIGSFKSTSTDAGFRKVFKNGRGNDFGAHWVGSRGCQKMEGWRGVAYSALQEHSQSNSAYIYES
jgi:hypothetical protein